MLDEQQRAYLAAKLKYDSGEREMKCAASEFIFSVHFKDCKECSYRDECEVYASLVRKVKEMKDESWCLITFCGNKGPVRGDPYYGLNICEEHWRILHASLVKAK